tara:strand:- start:897 stop:1232 length:336 start_codon:yes stop_codon:yes gene_type:complete
MSKLDDLLENYQADLETVGEKVDLKFLRSVAMACGPVIYRKDASFVAVSGKGELEHIRQNFLVEKLGLKDSEKLDAGIGVVRKKYSKKMKHRVVFYYLLTKHFKKSSVLMG